MKRREFIRNTAPVAVIPFLGKGLKVAAYADSAFLRAITRPEVDTDHVLVIVQMNGGNDGLNTLIPLDQYTNLSTLRSSVLIPQQYVLPLNGVAATGLHPSMTGMQNLYNNGQLGIVQGVSYPNPNYSHFRATDIWNTAADSNTVLTSGWVGRYMSEEYPNYPNGYPNATMPDPLAVQIGSVLSTALQGLSVNMGLAVPDPSSFYQLINGTNDPVPATPAGDELTYVRTVARQANQYGTTITNAFNASQTQSTMYPASGNSLSDQLKIVARLIKGGLKTRVYMTNIGSFDTHSAQVDTTDHRTGTHADLLSKLSTAIAAFQDDLAKMGIADRVLGMTFSEFGRRIISNSSGGTDHGSAAPMFLFGTKVQAGILGSNPSISAFTTVNDNLPMQYDFRSVYTSVLQNWFCLPAGTAQSTLLGTQPVLPIIDTGACVVPTHNYANVGDIYIRNFPNPFHETTTIEFEGTGNDNCTVEVYNPSGQRIAVLYDDIAPTGSNTVTFSPKGLAAGTYYYRYQRGALVQTKAMIIQ